MKDSKSEIKRVKMACDKAGITKYELGDIFGGEDFDRKIRTGNFTKEEFERMAKILGCKYVCYFRAKDGTIID